jgi:hypothetical protein
LVTTMAGSCEQPACISMAAAVMKTGISFFMHPPRRERMISSSHDCMTAPTFPLPARNNYKDSDRVQKGSDLLESDSFSGSRVMPVMQSMHGVALTASS